MKIRNGFVSNSSSSSFCIYGTYLESYDAVAELLEKLYPEKYNLNNTDAIEIVEDYCSENNLSLHSANDSSYIGRDYSEIGADETGKQFRESVDVAIKRILPDAHCDTIQEESYDG
jgi:hypothetical protein